jgi:hypothetical protein
MTSAHEVELTWGATRPVSFYLMNDGVGISLAGATITLSALWTGEQSGHTFESEAPTSWIPRSTVAIEDFECTPDADQSANPGLASFTPTTNMYAGAPPGVYLLQFYVIFADLSKEYYPRDAREMMYRLRIFAPLRTLND